MRLLLHTCCGPCSLEPTRIFREEDMDVRLAYINPNIHPDEEYVHRRETLLSYAASVGLSVFEGGYDPAEWERVVGVWGGDRPARCRACYRLRFERAANLALEQGCDALSTTLSVSPYQFTDIIAEELERAAGSRGLVPVFRDFRAYYPEATRRSRELGMYRQNFCGCHFSEEEARVEREERKARRKAEKIARRALALRPASGDTVENGVGPELVAGIEGTEARVEARSKVERASAPPREVDR